MDRPTTDHPQWRLEATDQQNLLVLSGDWTVPGDSAAQFPSDGLKSARADRPLMFRTDGLGRWNTALVSFLWAVKQAATQARFDFRSDTLPPSARKLLDLLPDRPLEQKPPRRAPFAPVAEIGRRTLDSLTEIGTVSELGATVAGGSLGALLGRSRMRASDLLANIRDAGPSSLLIVSIVNFLVGAILAFVGAVQLKKFAADIYVANLVGIAMVREMAAVMTAIIMAGRTGGAYAARIATMEGNEEIDALTVSGIPVSSYLILPSVLALIATMPLLYLYGCLVSMAGGCVVSVAMLNVTATGYLNQTLGAVQLDQFVFGFIKSIVFAGFIGLTSCRIGLKAGRSAADVGIAATRAVVVGIVGVIAIDAIFAVIANAINI
ncbi:MAG TPA: ABC transporter permease [Aliidongia sp.]|nr:ABC transporter permease [Aliidongia sp.]